MLREHQHRSSGAQVVDRFVESVRERMTYDASDLDPEILEQASKQFGVSGACFKTRQEHITESIINSPLDSLE